MKLDHFFTPHTKRNSKCIKDLNVRPETVKLLKENTGSKLLDTGLSNLFYMSPQTRKTKQNTKQNKTGISNYKAFPQ